MKPLTRETAKKLKLGAKLRVIDAISSIIVGKALSAGQIVTFSRLRSQTGELYLTDVIPGWSWRISRFEVVGSQTPRDANGRFSSDKPAVPRTAPSILRHGSLYSVKRKRGNVVARLRKTAHEDYLVFSEHDKKPFLVRRKQVTLADADEVKQYLSK